MCVIMKAISWVNSEYIWNGIAIKKCKIIASSSWFSLSLKIEIKNNSIFFRALTNRRKTNHFPIQRETPSPADRRNVPIVIPSETLVRVGKISSLESFFLPPLRPSPRGGPFIWWDGTSYFFSPNHHHHAASGVVVTTAHSDHQGPCEGKKELPCWWDTMGPSRNAKQKSIKMTNTISGVWGRAFVRFFFVGWIEFEMSKQRLRSICEGTISKDCWRVISRNWLVIRAIRWFQLRRLALLWTTFYL